LPNPPERRRKEIDNVSIVERHKTLERNVTLLAVLAFAAVTIGGIVEIAPLFWIDNTIEKWRMRPYTPLEQAGRDIYVREGCYVCHSQMIRPFRDETERYGHYSLAAESMYDHPFQWGSKRTGPDLARVGGKYSDEWHVQHLKDPRSVVPESIMPTYQFLAERPLNQGDMTAELQTLHHRRSLHEGPDRQGQRRLEGPGRSGKRHRIQDPLAQGPGSRFRWRSQEADRDGCARRLSPDARHAGGCECARRAGRPGEKGDEHVRCLRHFADSWALVVMGVIFLALCIWPFRRGASPPAGKRPTRSSRRTTMADKRIDEATGVETVGHEWDGIEELNTPCRAGGCGRSMPASPSRSAMWWSTRPFRGACGLAGTAGWTSRGALAKDLWRPRTPRAPSARAAIAATPIEQLADNPNLLRAIEGGAAAFKQNCVQCHGSGAAGSRAIPTSTTTTGCGAAISPRSTRRWSTASAIRASRPAPARCPFGRDGILTAAQVQDVVSHVRVISGQEKPSASSARGAQIFADNCSVCHGANGEGNRTVARRANDKIWLYGGDRATLTQTVTNARQGDAGLGPAARSGDRQDAGGLCPLAGVAKRCPPQLLHPTLPGSAGNR
jgi:cbb3-type cytochrome c oxidase subunit III